MTSPKIIKGEGLTVSEKYLARLCKKSFLSLWSYPNTFMEPGKEFSDLLVVFGSEIIIFSDKTSQYPIGEVQAQNWSRWFKRAIRNSATQLWGAESWIKRYPNKVFLDSGCQNRFPIDIDISNSKIHLIAVANGSVDACKKHFGGGSGSLMLNNKLEGLNAHTELFTIGDLNPDKTFVHVFDKTTLDIVFSTLDTITDFVSYLKKKELLFRSPRPIFATGEEDLLPHYLTNMKDGGHDFVFPDKYNSIAVVEGLWEEFCEDPRRIAQIKEDEKSYFIDDLIEQFAHHALEGTQHKIATGGVSESERITRFLASESRFGRRMLAEAILGLVAKTPKHQAGKRFVIPLSSASYSSNTHYAILTFPYREDKTEEENREVRLYYLYACCLVLKLTHPEATDIVGFATESGRGSYGSEDAIYFDARYWTPELEKEAMELQNEFKILTDPIRKKFSASEFPEIIDKAKKKTSRNEPCPCGRLKPDGKHKKYKNCCGK